MAEKKSRKKKYGQEDQAPDYLSSYTGGMDGAESAAPSVYSGEADYKSTYTIDETATVFSGLTGMDGAKTTTEYAGYDEAESSAVYTVQGGDETTSVYSGAETTSDNTKVSKRKKRKHSRHGQREEAADYKSTYTDGMDGAETLAPSIYVGMDDRPADYTSVYTDENATVYSGFTGMEKEETTTVYGAQESDEVATVYTGAETTTSNTTRASKKRKRRQSRQIEVGKEAAEDYKTTYTGGMDGAETAVTSEYLHGGDTAPDYKSMYTEENATVYSKVTGTPDYQEEPKANVMDEEPQDSSAYTGVEGYVAAQHVAFTEEMDETQSQVQFTDGVDEAMSEYRSMYAEGMDGAASDYVSEYNPAASEYMSMYTADPAARKTIKETVEPSIKPSTKTTKTMAMRRRTRQRRKLILKCSIALMFLMAMVYAGLLLTVIVTASQHRVSSLVSDLQATLELSNPVHSSMLQGNLRIRNMSQQTLTFIEELQLQIPVLENQNIENKVQYERMLTIGKDSSFPILSCADLPDYYPSGYYFIRSAKGSPAHLYCNMTLNCNGISGGWAQTAYLDMRNLSHQCPTGFEQHVNALGLRSCLSLGDRPGCSSLYLDQYGVEFSLVCGEIIGIQIGTPDAFQGTQNAGIDDPYVDGISLTYDSPRRHIWTFAMAIDESPRTTSLSSRCHCINGNLRRPDTEPPSFVRDHYFCDTGSDDENVFSSRFFFTDPLWDGAGCAFSNECCSFNNPPLFLRALPGSSNEDLEMRTCLVNSVRRTEDVAIRRYRFYVQ